MLVCLTGTIQPSKDIKDLQHMDQQKRLKEYVDNIIFLLQTHYIRKVILCESSLYQSPIFGLLSELAVFYGKEFVYITFQGNIQKVVAYGRGYGEQEILEYCMQDPSGLKKEDVFFKLTGRYKVINIDTICAYEQNNCNVFSAISPYDTRCSTAFFKTSVSFFQKTFQSCGDDINDRLGKNTQIEGIYKNRLQAHKSEYRSFVQLPIFEAHTGSGYILKKNYIKDTCKQIMNILGLYTV